MTIEQKFLQSKHIMNYAKYSFVEFIPSPVGEKDLIGNDIYTAHFVLNDQSVISEDKDLYVKITKLDKPYNALVSGYYLIDNKIQEILV